MSWRIEQADTLTLLRELPGGWAQSCVTRPPRSVPVPELLAVLEEVHRVLRADGTLWLALTGGGSTPDVLRSLEETEWLRPSTPRTASSERTPKNVVLFTKQPAYLFNPRPFATSAPEPCPMWATPARMRRVCGRCRSPRRAFCVPAPRSCGSLPLEVIEWCILTSTVPQACGVCGTPWQRIPQSTHRDRGWRRGCIHINGRGRSLVLDPFCGSGNTGLLAQRRCRDFLGIEQNRAIAELARRRLTSGQQGSRR
jgi:hypothetical protein